MSRILREKDKIYNNLTKKARWFQQNSAFLTHKDYFHVITVLQKCRLCLKYIQNSLANKKIIFMYKLSIHGLSCIHIKTVLSV